MRKIEIKPWETSVKAPKEDEEGMPVLDEKGKPMLEEKMVKESLLDVISNVVLNPQNMPRGMKPFRHCVALSLAFKEAEKNGVLVLEEADYLFAKEKLEKEVPAAWGYNENITNALMLFMDTKEEKPQSDTEKK